MRKVKRQLFQEVEKKRKNSCPQQNLSQVISENGDQKKLNKVPTENGTMTRRQKQMMEKQSQIEEIKKFEEEKEKSIQSEVIIEPKVSVKRAFKQEYHENSQQLQERIDTAKSKLYSIPKPKVLVDSKQKQTQITSQIQLRSAEKEMICPHKVLDYTDDVKELVQNYQGIAKTSPESLLQLYIYIYWPHDKVWYRGKILKHLPTSKKHKILYDDGNQENRDLTRDMFLIDQECEQRDYELLQLSEPIQNAKHLEKRVKKRSGKLKKRSKLKQILGKRPQSKLEIDTETLIRKEPNQKLNIHMSINKLKTLQDNKLKRKSQNQIVGEKVESRNNKEEQRQYQNFQSQSSKQGQNFNSEFRKLALEVRGELRKMTKEIVDGKKIYYEEYQSDTEEKIASRQYQNQDSDQRMHPLIESNTQDQQMIIQKQSIESENNEKKSNLGSERIRGQNEGMNSGSFIQGSYQRNQQQQKQQQQQNPINKQDIIQQSVDFKQPLINHSISGIQTEEALKKAYKEHQLGIRKVEDEEKINLSSIFDYTAYVRTVLENYYEENLQKGYKQCECLNCKKLLHPILIKSERRSEEFESLHLKYFQMCEKSVTTLQKGEQLSENWSETNKLNNIRIFCF